MKIIANKPDEDQSYKNNFKENGVYPFSKITRVVTDKNTGAIFERLNENNSEFSLNLNKSIFDYKKHDIMCLYPKFYYRRNWEEEELEDCIITDIPPEHINLIPESISDKSFEVFPCFVREDGTIRDYVLYSAFEGSIVDGQLRSIPNVEVTVDKTLEEFRGFARSDRNEKFNIENMSVIAMIQFLYKIGFQDLNSQKVLGKSWVKKQSKTKTGGTLKLGNRSGYQDPFANSPDKPDDRISLSFRVGENGEIAMYNARGTDPMPIKTRNMAGLQKWEETDDYIIYLDKDVVMTTVANYVTGTYDLFKERKADIDGSMELLRANEIEWTSEDDSKLILDINKAQLERIANTPTTMEEDAVSQTFTTRVVPTTYEACFRVDKKSGEIYIGEGYENLLKFKSLPTTIGSGAIQPIEFTNESVIITVDSDLTGNKWSRVVDISNFTNGDTLSLVCECISRGNTESEWIQLGTRGRAECFGAFTKGKNSKTIILNSGSGVHINIVYDSLKIGETLSIKNIQITKTSTPKPFVKSVMPSGKLAFVTDAVVDTHSFIVKGMDSTGVTANNYIWAHYLGQAEWNYTRVRCSSIYAKTLLLSSSFQTAIDSSGNSTGTVSFGSNSNGIIKFGERYYNEKIRSFKQLLIYKGNLTEAELKAENEKDIIADNQLDHNEYPSQYNSNSLFGIENFYGNVKRIIDGFIAKDDGYYYTAHPNKMGQISAYEKLPSQVITSGSNGVEGWSKKIDKQLGVFNIPTELNEQKDVNGVVTRGLIEHFDFADGKGTEATLKSRVSDNVLTLTNFNFDENSGWTGKGLRFDGVDDLASVTIEGAEECNFFEIAYSRDRHITGANNFTLTTTKGLTVFCNPSKATPHEEANDSGFVVLNSKTVLGEAMHFQRVPKNKNFSTIQLGSNGGAKEFSAMTLHSIKIYNIALTEEEIAQNYEYEQSIDRTTISTYPLLQEQKSYGIGLTSQLSEEKKSTFRLSIDGTKFVAGLRYCEGLEVEEFTYSEIQKEMEKEEWSSKEEEFEVNIETIEQNTKTQSSIEEHRLTSKSDTKTSEETHYTDYFISHAPNKENIAIFGSDFEAEEKAGVFTLDLNKEINHKDDRTSARLVILP